MVLEAFVKKLTMSSLSWPLLSTIIKDEELEHKHSPSDNTLSKRRNAVTIRVWISLRANGSAALSVSWSFDPAASYPDALGLRYSQTLQPAVVVTSGLCEK